MYRIVSMYWRNIPEEIVRGQQMVFEALGFPLIQVAASGIQHGRWIDSLISSLDREETLLIIDIDAIPLNREIVERALSVASKGKIFGVAQTANHVANSTYIYAAPAFLCFRKDTWIAAGQPSFLPDSEYDVGMRFSVEAQRAAVEVEVVYPNQVLVPRWNLGGKGCLGLGTFYEEMSIFHLFESRSSKLSRHGALFTKVVERVIEGRNVDILEVSYLARSLVT